MAEVDLTPAELSYVLGGLLDRYEETMRNIASTERMLAGEPCCDKTRGRHEHNVEILAAFKKQHAILESAIKKVRAAEPECSGTCAPHLHQFCSPECEAKANG